MMILPAVNWRTRGEGVLERVGAVAEVDVDARAAVAGDPLGAAGEVGLDAAVPLAARAPIASSSKPASTSMTIARAALAAMCQPMSGSRVTSGGPRDRQPELGVGGGLVEDLDDPLGVAAGRGRQRWSTGIRDSATTRAP